MILDDKIVVLEEQNEPKKILIVFDNEDKIKMLEDLLNTKIQTNSTKVFAFDLEKHIYQLDYDVNSFNDFTGKVTFDYRYGDYFLRTVFYNMQNVVKKFNLVKENEITKSDLKKIEEYINSKEYLESQEEKDYQKKRTNLSEITYSKDKSFNPKVWSIKEDNERIN